jgi:predicted acetyltransferase
VEISIKQAAIEHKPVIHALLQPYLDELSRFPDEHPDPKDSRGVYVYPYLDNYWQEPGIRFPYLLYADGEIAGFALVRKDANHWEMVEFYVKPEFRGKQLAETCAKDILGRHSGIWRIEFNRHNQDGRNLWTKMAKRFSPGNFTEGKSQGSHDFIQFDVLDNTKDK